MGLDDFPSLSDAVLDKAARKARKTGQKDARAEIRAVLKDKTLSSWQKIAEIKSMRYHPTMMRGNIDAAYKIGWNSEITVALDKLMMG